MRLPRRKKKSIYYFEISKFSPTGVALEDEWSSISDVGKHFGGRVLTAEEYQKWEDRYLAAIRLICQSLNVETLEVGAPGAPFELPEWPPLYTDGTLVGLETALHMARGVLREELHCVLRGPDRLCFQFGYDYEFFVRTPSSLTKILSEIAEIGLYSVDLEPDDRLFDGDTEGAIETPANFDLWQKVEQRYTQNIGNIFVLES